MLILSVVSLVISCYLSGWSVLLGKKELKAASKQLREMCTWQSDVPSILSACLVSLEPDSNLRIFTDQYTPDERFGQTASNCQLSTPKDASCTHILVFPTSAKAQVSCMKGRTPLVGIMERWILSHNRIYLAGLSISFFVTISTVIAKCIRRESRRIGPEWTRS